MDLDEPLPLLGGLSPTQFMRRHWQKKPLLVRQALPGIGAPLPRAELFALAARDDVESRLVQRHATGWSLRHGPLPRRALPPLSRPAWTLLVQGLDLHLQAAHELLARFRFVPGARLDDLMLSYASDGGGVGPHLDSYDVFLLQVHGRRRWRVGRPADAAFVEGLPLKILRRFEPEHDWLLEPGDLLWIALATALTLAAFATDRMALVAAAAVFAALGVAWVKSAVLAAPWVGLLCIERIIALRAWHPRHWAIPATAAVTLLLTIAPIISQLQAQPNFLWRYEDVLRQRAALLETAGMTSLDGYLGGLAGAFTVLQVREAPLGRHIARLKFPALDPITSALATLGLVWAAWRWRREWGGRVAILGFLLFMWPAISSYPTEAAPAVSRRMIGSAFFICWLAGYGADIVTRLTLPASRRLAAMLALGTGAIVLNAYYLRTDYDVRLYHLAEEMGTNRAAIIHALRQSAATGPVLFRPTRNTESALAGTVDLPYVIGVGTTGDLRAQLAQFPGRLVTIILPTDTLAEQTDASQWMAELADVIPPSSWQFGTTDPAGTPYYRRALIRTAGPTAVP